MQYTQNLSMINLRKFSQVLMVERSNVMNCVRRKRWTMIGC